LASFYDFKHMEKYFWEPPKIFLDNSSNDEYIKLQKTLNTKSEIIFQCPKFQVFFMNFGNYNFEFVGSSPN